MTTDQPARPVSWWPAVLLAGMTVLMVLFAVEQSLRDGFHWHAVLLPAAWAYLTVNRWSRTKRQRTGRPPWWVEHARGTLAINVTTLVAVTAFWVYCLTHMGAEHPVFVFEAILCTLLVPFTVYVAVVQWRLRNAETDWPWWDQPWWRWRIDKSRNIE